MDIEIINSYPSLSRQDIRAAEVQLGVRFPDDYVMFLLRHNGGQFRRPLTYSMVEEPVGGTAGLSHFYGIVRSEIPDPSDLRNQDSAISCDGMPRLVEIALDRSGCIYLCCQAGSDFGKCFLRLFDSSEEKELHLVSRSFTEFLASFQTASDSCETANPIFRFVEEGDFEALTKAITQGESDVELRDEAGLSLLFASCIFKSPRCLKALLDLGADISAKSPLGELPIHAAVRSNCLDCVRVLIQSGVDVDSLFPSGDTLLLASLKPEVCNDLRMAEQLIDLGATIVASNGQEVEDGNQDTALALASTWASEYTPFSSGYCEVREKLLSKGADPKRAIFLLVRRIRNSEEIFPDRVLRSADAGWPRRAH